MKQVINTKADGTIYIDTEIDISGFQKGSQDLEAAAKRMAAKVEKIGKNLVEAIGQNMLTISEPEKATEEQLSDALDEANAKKEDIVNMNNQLSTSYDDLQQQLNKYQDQLKETRDKTEETRNATNNLGKSTSSFGKRLSRLISGALVFNVISSGLRSMTNYMGKALKSNSEFSSSLAKLKAAFMTAFQPIYELAVPALTTLMRIMTAAITVIGNFFAAITGKSYAQMKNNAKALNNQAKAIGGVGSAAKDAGKQLMAFDELNVLNDQKEMGGGGAATGEIAPDYSWTDELSDKLKKIAEDVLLVGIGFALWKISDALPAGLGSILKKIGLVVIAVGFLKLAWDGFTDAWENGINWDNLLQTIVGIAGAAIALGIAFGPIAAGIVLLAGGIALVVLALREYNKTGELSKKACDALMAGIVGICLAIGILTGAWIPLLIAGILHLAYKLADFLGYGELFRDGIGDILGGVVDIFKSVFAFDLPGILDGFERGFNGFNDVLTAIVSSIIDGIITLINKTFGTKFKTLKEQGRGDGSSVNEKQHGGGGGTFGDKEAKTEFSNFSKSIADLINQNTATKDTLDRLNESENKLSQALSEMNTYTFAGGNMQSLLSSGYQVPYLATGAVIPPRATYSAGSANQEVVKSIDLLADIFKQSANEESVGNSRVESLLIELINAVSNIRIGDDVIGRAASRYYRTTSRARGW